MGLNPLRHGTGAVPLSPFGAAEAATKKLWWFYQSSKHSIHYFS
ncbi:hypothetical protein SynTAK9802_02054 [Synechococcus sp. TAK9802]|nr:hypothetical protein SynTAK9802_02054 [Synechococcus sp. TAK9802]